MNLIRIAKLTKRLIELLIAIFIASSCNTSENLRENFDAPSVNITISGVKTDGGIDDNLQKIEQPTERRGKNRSITTSNQGDIQEFIIPFSDNMIIQASLVPDGMTGTTRATETTPLGNGVKYSVVVYNGNGNFVSKTDYTYDSSSQTHGSIKNLNQGETYTFIVYSVNSTSSLPSVTNQNNLSTAGLSGISEDLMFFKQAVAIQSGVNNISVILKHKFSLITSKLSVDPSIGGSITSFIPPIIKPACISADISFADESLEYNNKKTTESEVSFGSLGTGVGSITSTPTLIINPATSSGTYEIGSITVNNSTNSVVLQNVKINPGYKYNLNLNFKIPCTKDTGVSFNVDGSAKPQTINAPKADYGFVFDIYSLDNSFNMTINGTPLATKELQFEIYGGGTTTPQPLPQNVRFADGDYWEMLLTQNPNITMPGSYLTTGDYRRKIPSIFNMNSSRIQSPNNIVIRVVIDYQGNVSLYGSKSQNGGGTLYPLVLDASKRFETRVSPSWNNVTWDETAPTFNKITWNPDGDNTVVISQKPIGTTYMVGYGYGKQIINCN